MAAITPQMVKELRDKTDAGMLDCKKALAETDGDMEKAVEFLRKSGIAKAEKRVDRVTKEGKIFAVVDGGKGVMIEVLCETDFVAKNEKFIEYVEKAAKNILANTTGNGDISEAAQKLEEEDLKALFTKFGEKMILRRVLRFESAAKLGCYIHGGGRVGVMVEMDGEADAELIKNSCLHIAAFNPQFVCSCQIDEARIAKEKEIAAAQITGKPANIVDKIVTGKIQKWFSDVCFVDQPWIMDDKSSFKKLFPKAKMVRFARWAVGEEI